ncbi:MAG TPA: D-alanyl-D-alanine carboxypeptidase/D-alanyl-D-alanine-endopeptidase [Candidatus Acidoferrales bacterium]|nr:D-alanyl-D-alanine carboxypeptidase/D-alanyl-D-alanine-endopeptidase [Candidatus Acidoferrales bacterium]
MRNFQPSSRLLARALVAALGLLLPGAPLAAPAARSRATDSPSRLAAAIDAILAEPGARQSDWGILIVDQQTGEILYQRNPAHYFIPASNAKLFTSALALASLGPDFRWRTTLETSGETDSAGTLHGDLVLVGRGDPNLSNRKFPFGEKEEFEGPPEKALADLADQAVAGGLKRIAGDVVADDTYFSYERYPPGWSVGDLTREYGAAVSAIVVDDNAVEVDVAPGGRVGDPASFQVLPWAGFYRFADRAATVAAGSQTQVDLWREPDALEVTLSGQIPLDAQPVKLQLAVEQPARYAATLLKRLLEQRGVAVYGQSRALHWLPGEPAPQPPPRRVVAEHLSPTLAQAVRYLLKVSQNLHAECLLRTVACEKTGVGSRRNGLEFERQFLSGIGVADDVVLFDGSGLSRSDLVTPEAVVALLRYAASQTWAPTYLNALPVAGRDGTLEHRMNDTPAEGRLFAKTGTLVHDSSLSGYATTVSGRHLVFSIFANNDPPDERITPFVDRIAAAMVTGLGASPPPAKPSMRRPDSTP